jgi:hypothetical protein
MQAQASIAENVALVPLDLINERVKCLHSVTRIDPTREHPCDGFSWRNRNRMRSPPLSESISQPWSVCCEKFVIGGLDLALNGESDPPKRRKLEGKQEA